MRRTYVRYGGGVAFPDVSPIPHEPSSSHERLRSVARSVRPTVLAGERVVPVADGWEGLLPGRGLQRGSVVVLDGPPGRGTTSLALQLIAAATASGEWSAFVDLDGTLGGVAAAGAGTSLDRMAVVRGVSADQWAAVAAALIDGVPVVAAEVPSRLRHSEARRLVARVRERDAVLLAVGRWPVEAATTLRAEGGPWSGLGRGEGLLAGRDLTVAVEHRGMARTVAIAG